MNFSPEEVAESSASVGGSHSVVGGGDLSPVVGVEAGQPGMSGMRYDATSNAPDHRRVPRSLCHLLVIEPSFLFSGLLLSCQPAR